MELKSVNLVDQTSAQNRCAQIEIAEIIIPS